MKARYKKVAIVTLSLCISSAATAQTAVMREGQPAVECRSTTDGAFSWTITLIEQNGKSAFSIPATTFANVYPGTLYLTSERFSFHAQKEKHPAFLDADESRRDFAIWPFSDRGKLDSYILRKNLAPKVFQYNFYPSAYSGKHQKLALLEEFPACASLVTLAFSDFPASERLFRHITRALPPVMNAAWRDFQPKAAAWRLLSPKPPLCPEADREWILAENAFKERSLEAAVQHYEAGVEIQPMWPTGWFNLAMIYAELKKFADASDAMKHYLELVPDAPDARNAREQMIIWEDKAKH